MSTTSNIKYADTKALQALALDADRHGYNRRLDLDRLDLDPDGNHVLSLVLYGHNMDTDDLHHRTRVFIKVNGTMDPVMGWLDVAAGNWDRLAAPERVEA